MTRRRQRGVALVELVIASVIFALAMLGMFQAWRLCFSLATQGREEALASQIGRAEMEVTRIQGFDNVPLGEIVSGASPYRGAWTDAVRYYDTDGLALDSSAISSRRFFSSVRSGTDYGVLREQSGSKYSLAPSTLRSIVVTVKRVADGESIVTMGIHLAKGGL